MKFPALALAVTISAGILAGGISAAHFPHALTAYVAASVLALAAGFIFVFSGFTYSAGAASLLAWFLLGILAAQLQPLAVPPDNVARLASQGSLDLSQPLRWRGALRSDPLALPWGLRYDVDLQEVRSADTWRPLAGGMRLEYFFDENKPTTAGALRAGDRVEVLARARVPRNFGDPGAFDEKGYLAGQDIYLTATLRDAALLERLPGPPPTLPQRIRRLRGRLLQEVDAMLAGSPDEAAVARAMLLGDRSFLDREQADRFRETGVFHVLVLAGLHVGMLAVFLLWIARRVLRLSLSAGVLLTLSTLGAYVAIVEDRPPILRAALMAAVYLLGLLIFRRLHLLNAVGIAAILILLFRPSELTDSSFQLSFLAAGTIAGIALPLLDRSSGRYRLALDHISDVTRDRGHAPQVAQFRLDARAAAQWLAEHGPRPISRLATNLVTVPCRVALRFWDLILLTVVIQIAMVPLMALYFHRITLVGFAANLPAVLLTGIVVPLGFLSLGANLIWGGLGHAMGHVLGLLVAALVGSVNWFAQWTRGSFRVPSPPLPLLLAFFILLAVCAGAILTGRRSATWAATLSTLALAAAVAIHPFAPRLNKGRLELTVLDVGQGDSLFLAFPDGRTMLVDGGGLPGSFYVRGVRPGIDVGEDVVSPFLWSRGLKRIDVVALTHAHEDHLGGLSAVLRNFRVGELWVGRDVQTAAYRSLLDEAVARGVPVIHHVRGDTFDWDGVQGRVLWPADNDPGKSPSNDDSLVLRLEQNDEALLLAGDIERPDENALLRDPQPLSADFLKVPHHGGKTSTTEGFLEAVHPKFAAISVGDPNPYGHPSPEVLERIQAEGARLYRTDRDGAVSMLSDGHNIEIHTFFNSQ